MHTSLAARILSRLRKATSAWRVRLARACGAELGAGCVLGPGCDILLGFAPPRRGRLALGPGCELAGGVILHPYGGSVRIGANVYIGPGSVVYGHGGVEIGDDTLVAMHCRILSAEHDLPPMGTPIRGRGDIVKPSRIGRDVWLGAGVTVLGGVTIGDGCVVGAGAVVTRDLPPGAIAVGIPARVVGHRPAANPPPGAPASA